MRPKLTFHFLLKPRVNDVVEYRHTREGLRMTWLLPGKHVLLLLRFETRGFLIAIQLQMAIGT